jgi:flagellar biosynthesis/type III secretory pathway chaperone
MRMDAAALAALNALLNRELAAGEALLGALEAERAALAGFHVGALEAATLEKERLAAEFDRLDADRRRLLERFGFGPGRGGMTALIREVEDPAYSEAGRRAGPLATRWRKVVALIERGRDANERNGMIIGLQTRRITQTLNVLRTGRPDELTYTRHPLPGLAAAARALGRV